MILLCIKLEFELWFWTFRTSQKNFTFANIWFVSLGRFGHHGQITRDGWFTLTFAIYQAIHAGHHWYPCGGKVRLVYFCVVFQIVPKLLPEKRSRPKDLIVSSGVLISFSAFCAAACCCAAASFNNGLIASDLIFARLKGVDAFGSSFVSEFSPFSSVFSSPSVTLGLVSKLKTVIYAVWEHSLWIFVSLQ